MQENQILGYADGKVVLTPDGIPLARVVAAVFDRYLRDSAVRHSVAV